MVEAVIFLVGFLEEVIFIIPSQLIFLGVGFFFIDPALPIGRELLVLVIKMSFWGALGVTLGSYLVYGLFYWGGKRFLENYGRYIGVKWEAIAKLEQKFNESWMDESVIFILRALPIWSMTVVSAFAGLIRIKWREFGLFTFLGSVVRVAALILIGWQLGELYYLAADRLGKIEIFGTLALLILSLFFFVYYFYWRKKNR